MASKWGHPNNQPTCLAPNATQKTRRDFIFVTASLVSAITGFKVSDDGTYAVHSAVTATFTTKADPYRALSFLQAMPITAPPVATGLGREEWMKIARQQQQEEL